MYGTNFNLFREIHVNLSNYLQSLSGVANKLFEKNKSNIALTSVTSINKNVMQLN